MNSNSNSVFLNVHASPFFPSQPSHLSPSSIDVIGTVIQKVIGWGFSSCIAQPVVEIMSEWYAGNTVNSIFNLWEKKSAPTICQQTPLNILAYNVQGWGTRALESIELIFKSDSSICIFSEVGELWNSFTIPHFNIFYQKGTNSKGGVVVAVGKNLKATRIDIEIENTVILDVDGLTEPVRVIGVYWPHCQNRKLDDLSPFITGKTVLAGDFNASVNEWNSPATDARGLLLKKWIDKANLLFIPGTKNSSKRSARHIDLIFTNIADAKAETLVLGTSDHWPLVMKSDQIGFQTNGHFPVVNWKVFEVVLNLLQEFWINEFNKQDADSWYKTYVLFLAALKNRVTKWRYKDKYRPSLPLYIITMLKEVRQVRNKYYRVRKNSDGLVADEYRKLLRTRTRLVTN